LTPPIEPLPTRWALPSPDRADTDGIAGIGADLEPGTLLAAYRSGLFPMPIKRPPVIAWWSPDPRGVLPLDSLRVTRSLRASCHRYDVRIDTAFDEVIAACADPGRDHGWIDDEIRAAYRGLHRLGWAHSVEAWTPEGELAGGLYGVAIGGLFAGESMFHRRRDASKVALVHLVERLRAADYRVIDCQQATAHLASLGAREIPRQAFAQLLRESIQYPPSGESWRS